MKKGQLTQFSGVALGIFALLVILTLGFKAGDVLVSTNCPTGSTYDQEACYSCSTGTYDVDNNYCVNSQTDTLSVGNVTTTNLSVQSNLISASGTGLNETGGGSITSDLTFNYTAGNVLSISTNYTNASISYEYSTTRTTAGSTLTNNTLTLMGASGLGLIVSLLPLVIIILLFVGLFVGFKFLKD